MSRADRFFDTNVLLYLLSADDAKADRAEIELAQGGVLSVQVLNEFASVAANKLKMSIAEITEFLSTIRSLCKVVALDEDTHDLGMKVTQRYKIGVYDAMIVAAAILAKCNKLISEDLQNGQVFAGTLRVFSPF